MKGLPARGVPDMAKKLGYRYAGYRVFIVTAFRFLHQ